MMKLLSGICGIVQVSTAAWQGKVRMIAEEWCDNAGGKLLVEAE